jgi:hypothetical protein
LEERFGNFLEFINQKSSGSVTSEAVARYLATTFFAEFGVKGMTGYCVVKLVGVVLGNSGGGCDNSFQNQQHRGKYCLFRFLCGWVAFLESRLCADGGCGFEGGVNRALAIMKNCIRKRKY